MAKAQLLDRKHLPFAASRSLFIDRTLLEVVAFFFSLSETHSIVFIRVLSKAGIVPVYTLSNIFTIRHRWCNYLPDPYIRPSICSLILPPSPLFLLCVSLLCSLLATVSSPYPPCPCLSVYCTSVSHRQQLWDLRNSHTQRRIDHIL